MAASHSELLLDGLDLAVSLGRRAEARPEALGAPLVSPMLLPLRLLQDRLFLVHPRPDRDQKATQQETPDQQIAGQQQDPQQAQEEHAVHGMADSAVGAVRDETATLGAHSPDRCHALLAGVSRCGCP